MHPSRYPAVHLPPFRGLRKLVYCDYLIFYHISAYEVEVIHVLQGHRTGRRFFVLKLS